MIRRRAIGNMAMGRRSVHLHYHEYIPLPQSLQGLSTLYNIFMTETCSIDFNLKICAYCSSNRATHEACAYTCCPPLHPNTIFPSIVVVSRGPAFPNSNSEHLESLVLDSVSRSHRSSPARLIP